MDRRIIFFWVLIFCFHAEAKRFTNAYVSFELPPNWNCKLEGSEWVCESEFSSRTKEALIILTAKEVGPADNLGAYKAHLQIPRDLPGKGGVPVKSQMIHTKERLLGNHMWIDSMHLGSEVGPYFTRYLGTIKDRIAILITFSAHKEHYTKYSGDFIRAVDSMRVIATRDSFGNRNLTPSPGAGSEVIGPATGQSLPTIMDDSGLPDPNSAPGSKRKKYLNGILLAIVLGALGWFFYMRARRQRGKEKRSKQK